MFKCFNFVLSETVISKLLKCVSLYSYISLSSSRSCSYPNALKIIVCNPGKRIYCHMIHMAVSSIMCDMGIDFYSSGLKLGCWFHSTYLLPDTEMSC